MYDAEVVVFHVLKTLSKCDLDSVKIDLLLDKLHIFLIQSLFCDLGRKRVWTLSMHLGV
jgi:hypothetical protein